MSVQVEPNQYKCLAILNFALFPYFGSDYLGNSQKGIQELL